MFYSVIPVIEMLLPPTKPANGLVIFFRPICKDSNLNSNGNLCHPGHIMAKSFASETPGIEDDSTTTGPFLNLLFTVSFVAAKSLKAI